MILNQLKNMIFETKYTNGNQQKTRRKYGEFHFEQSFLTNQKV